LRFSTVSIWPLPKWMYLSVNGSGFLKSSGSGWFTSRWWCPALPAVLPAGTRPRMDSPKRTRNGDSSLAPSVRLLKYACGWRAGGGTTHGWRSTSASAACWPVADHRLPIERAETAKAHRG